MPVPTTATAPAPRSAGNPPPPLLSTTEVFFRESTPLPPANLQKAGPPHSPFGVKTSTPPMLYAAVSDSPVLAYTGANLLPGLALGGSFVLGGAVIVRLARHRRA
jgi:hypothetical protein